MPQINLLQLQLAKKAKRGNSKALEKLLQQEADYLYRVAYHYLKNEQDALDAIQEATAEAMKSIKTLKEPRYFYTWYTRILIRCAGKILKKRDQFQLADLSQLENEVAVAVPEISVTMDVQNALQQLDEKYREVLEAFYFQTLSVKEIANRDHVPVNTVKTNLRRGREQMKMILGGDYFDN